MHFFYVTYEFSALGRGAACVSQMSHEFDIVSVMAGLVQMLGTTAIITSWKGISEQSYLNFHAFSEGLSEVRRKKNPNLKIVKPENIKDLKREPGFPSISINPYGKKD